MIRLNRSAYVDPASVIGVEVVANRSPDGGDFSVEALLIGGQRVQAFSIFPSFTKAEEAAKALVDDIQHALAETEVVTEMANPVFEGGSWRGSPP
jgi:hypothetical protein